MGKGWLGASLTKKRLRILQKIEARNTSELCGVGSRGPLRGPGGVQGQSPWWATRGQSPWKLFYFSMQKQQFQHFWDFFGRGVKMGLMFTDFCVKSTYLGGTSRPPSLVGGAPK